MDQEKFTVELRIEGRVQLGVTVRRPPIIYKIFSDERRFFFTLTSMGKLTKIFPRPPLAIWRENFRVLSHSSFYGAEFGDDCVSLEFRSYSFSDTNNFFFVRLIHVFAHIIFSISFPPSLICRWLLLAKTSIPRCRAEAGIVHRTTESIPHCIHLRRFSILCHDGTNQA